MGRTIALATPVFFAMIAIEWLVGRRRRRSNYRLNDALNSLSLGVMSQLVGLFTKLLAIGLYAWTYGHFALAALPADAWWVWVLGVVVYDFCYYWNHRLGHESAVFWAAHVVHHQSEEYNLTTALRQTSSGALLGWLFYLPMAVAGFPPEVFVVAAIVDLLYQYWIHTELVGRLGWFDRWFASPSNHRVHHAVNDRYLDRNYGGIFMCWDRMFGTFVEEGERCVYGTRAPLRSWDPLWANLEVYADLARRSWRATRLRDRVLVWIMPPGWQPASGATWHSTHFDVATVRRYDPPMGGPARTFAVVQFTLVVVGTVPLLWYASELPFAALCGWAGLAIGLLWATGAVMQGRLGVGAAVAIELAAVMVLALAARSAGAAPVPSPSRAASVVDDPGVQAALERARAGYLAGRNFDRLQATVLVESADGRWLRGSVGGGDLAYPASCVKLAYLVAAAHWCAASNRAPDCLDRSVRPMVVESDNVATGEVVDAVTGAPNAPVEGSDVVAWIARRLYTEQVLDAAGLLAGQRAINKTYPTNSGEEPTGLEALIRERLGRNAMSPDGAARLMLAVARGAVEPQAAAYMRGLLTRPTFSPESAIGGGLPPGTRLLSKAGWAYDTLEDIAWAELPNGRRVVVAVFTNGYDQDEPEPGALYRLNPFMEALVAGLGLASGLPSPRVLEPVATADGEAYTVALDAPEAGWYELAAWYDASPDAAGIAAWRVEHAGGESVVTLDERTWGSRWIPLGDVRLDRGGGRVTVTGRDGRTVPGRVRMTRWSVPPPSAEAPAEAESERH
ncbi:MAG: sterol desaturase family protein [Steroidobacteraceae bacterium]